MPSLPEVTSRVPTLRLIDATGLPFTSCIVPFRDVFSGTQLTINKVRINSWKSIIEEARRYPPPDALR